MGQIFQTVWMRKRMSQTIDLSTVPSVPSVPNALLGHAGQAIVPSVPSVPHTFRCGDKWDSGDRPSSGQVVAQ